MNRLENAFRKIARFLDDRNQPWALIGGLAVSVRTEPRFTRDIDLAVTVGDDRSAEKLVYDVQAEGFRVLATVEQDATHRLATARMAPCPNHSSGLMLDLLFASSGIEAEICAEAEPLRVFAAWSVPVAQIYHLIALKVLSRDDARRPQDAGDLRQLLLAASPADLERALHAVHLIEARGFHRSRNLVEALLQAWRTFRV